MEVKPLLKYELEAKYPSEGIFKLFPKVRRPEEYRIKEVRIPWEKLKMVI